MPFINYEFEQKTFEDLIQEKDNFRILMFHGEGGIGKSRLLAECLSKLPSYTRYLAINLRERTTNVGDFLSKINRRSQLESLQNFNYCVESLQKTNELPLYSELLTSSFNFSAKSSSKRHSLQLALTDSWLADLQIANSPFLLVIDSFELATEEFEEWLTHHMLPRVVETKQMRVLLAGRTIPKPALEWESFVQIHKLHGIPDANLWLPVAEAMEREVPSIDYLEGAIAMAKGNPSFMTQFISMLPKKAMYAPSDATQAQLLKILENQFSTDELRVLCFDLDVDYSSLTTQPSNLMVKELVKELIEYSKRHNRLNELVNACRQIRPKVNWTEL